MNKGDLIDLVADALGESKASAGKAVDAVFSAITSGVSEHEKVSISGFGTFRKSRRKARTGVHPVTREPMQIAPSTTVQFKPSQSLKDQLT